MKYFVLFAIYLLSITIGFTSYAYAEQQGGEQQESSLNDSGKTESHVDDKFDKSGDLGDDIDSGDNLEIEGSNNITIDEAKKLIESFSSSSDVVFYEVGIPDYEFYDIYGRSLAFRESAKKLRASLEKRREAFEGPRVEVIEKYREVKGKVYSAEAEASFSESEGDYDIEDNDSSDDFIDDETGDN